MVAEKNDSLPGRGAERVGTLPTAHEPCIYLKNMLTLESRL